MHPAVFRPLPSFSAPSLGGGIQYAGKSGAPILSHRGGSGIFSGFKRHIKKIGAALPGWSPRSARVTSKFGYWTTTKTVLPEKHVSRSTQAVKWDTPLPRHASIGMESAPVGIATAELADVFRAKGVDAMADVTNALLKKINKLQGDPSEAFDRIKEHFDAAYKGSIPQVSLRDAESHLCRVFRDLEVAHNGDEDKAAFWKSARYLAGMEHAGPFYDFMKRLFAPGLSDSEIGRLNLPMFRTYLNLYAQNIRPELFDNVGKGVRHDEWSHGAFSALSSLLRGAGSLSDEAIEILAPQEKSAVRRAHNGHLRADAQEALGFANKRLEKLKDYVGQMRRPRQNRPGKKNPFAALCRGTRLVGTGSLATSRRVKDLVHKTRQVHEAMFPLSEYRPASVSSSSASLNGKPGLKVQESIFFERIILRYWDSLPLVELETTSLNAKEIQDRKAELATLLNELKMPLPPPGSPFWQRATEFFTGARLTRETLLSKPDSAKRPVSILKRLEKAHQQRVDAEARPGECHVFTDPGDPFVQQIAKLNEHVDSLQKSISQSTMEWAWIRRSMVKLAHARLPFFSLRMEDWNDLDAWLDKKKSKLELQLKDADGNKLKVKDLRSKLAGLEGARNTMEALLDGVDRHAYRGTLDDFLLHSIDTINRQKTLLRSVLEMKWEVHWTAEERAKRGFPGRLEALNDQCLGLVATMVPEGQCDSGAAGAGQGRISPVLPLPFPPSPLGAAIKGIASFCAHFAGPKASESANNDLQGAAQPEPASLARERRDMVHLQHLMETAYGSKRTEHLKSIALNTWKPRQTWHSMPRRLHPLDRNLNRFQVRERLSDPIGFLAQILEGGLEVGDRVQFFASRGFDVMLDSRMMMTPLMYAGTLGAGAVQAYGKIGARKTERALIDAGVSGTRAEIRIGIAKKTRTAAGGGISVGFGFKTAGASLGLDAASDKEEAQYLVFSLPRNGSVTANGVPFPAGIPGDAALSGQVLSRVARRLGEEIGNGSMPAAMIDKLMAEFPSLSVSVQDADSTGKSVQIAGGANVVAEAKASYELASNNAKNNEKLGSLQVHGFQHTTAATVRISAGVSNGFQKLLLRKAVVEFSPWERTNKKTTFFSAMMKDGVFLPGGGSHIIAYSDHSRYTRKLRKYLARLGANLDAQAMLNSLGTSKMAMKHYNGNASGTLFGGLNAEGAKMLNIVGALRESGLLETLELASDVEKWNEGLKNGRPTDMFDYRSVLMKAEREERNEKGIVLVSDQGMSEGSYGGVTNKAALKPA
jgi:hypothetical protein